MFEFAVGLIFLTGIILVILALSGKTFPGLLVVAFLLPLRNVIERLHEMPMGKDYIDILLLSIVFGWMLRALGSGRKIFLKNKFNLPVLLLVFYTLFSLWRGLMFLPVESALSEIRLEDWKNYMILPLLFLIVVNTVKNKKQLKILMTVMTLSIIVVNYYTFQQLRFATGIMSRLKVHGTFVSLGSNELAAFFAMYFFVLLGMFFYEKKFTKKMFFGAAAGVCVWSILFLYSRGAYFAFLSGLFYIFFRKKKILLVPLVLFVMLWNAVLPENVVTRINQTTDDEGRLDSSSETRIELWETSMGMFSKEPVFGIGFSVFRDLGLIKADPHNMFVKTLVEQGIVGFILFIYLLFIAMKTGLRLFQEADDRFYRGLGLGFTACVVAAVFANFFGNRWTYIQVGSFFWLFLGMAVKARMLAGSK